MSDSGPAEAAPAGGRRSWRGARWRRIGGVVALGVVCIVAIFWTQRRPIATAVIDRKLADAHVRARYRIVDLGFGRQRLVDVVVGDPARPDLSASWLELGTRLGLDGAHVTAVRAGGLRLRGSLAGGRLSLGALDRLLPHSTGGGAFRFPAIDLDVTDGRLRLAAAPGVIDLALTGQGRLDNGFDGHLTASSRHLAAGGCTADGLSAAGDVGTRRGALRLRGPLRAAHLVCPGAAAENAVVDLTATLARGMARWNGSASLAVGRLLATPLAVRRVRGRLTFAGSAAATTGEARLAGGPAAIRGVTGRTLAVAGRYRLGSDPAFVGRARAGGVSLPAALLADLRRQGMIAPATPITPLLARAAAALAAAGRDVDVAGAFGLTRRGVTLARLNGMARSGATVGFAPDRAVSIGWHSLPAVAGTVRLSGGGLPTATVRLAQSAPHGPVSGVATILPYAAGGARLALDPVRFTAGADAARIVTAATLSGPLADGRVDGLRVPVVASWQRPGRLTVNPGCVALAFDRLAVSTLRLGATRLPLCPIGPALVRTAAGKVEVGARLPSLRLAGSLGSTPLTLAADDARLLLAAHSIAARHVAVRLGEGEAATRFDIGRLAGTLSATGSATRLGGRFEDAGGRIGTVPLLLSHAAGDWRLEGSALSLAGTVAVADTAPQPRFRPLLVDAVELRLAGGTIDATGRLVVPGKAVRVADLSIAHDLGRGTGHATVSVPRLAFTEGLQPDELTPLTFGVIADVRGTVTGDARIDWNRQGVTSTGTFRTDGLDLAAAFGPVTGLAGAVRFTDLLALESAPDQVATVASINPGIPVTDGRVVYRLLPNARVGVASGHWPFAGGSLDLQPTVLDFAAASERHLTFGLTGVDAGRFLQQFDFSNLNATGRFDGTLPMIFDGGGGRIEGGRIAMRTGGGNIAYVGNLSQKDLGFWSNLAFQALRSIDYRDLAITMNGPLDGEMITEVRFAGISQGKGAKSNVLIRRLQKLPFVFNIRIHAPFRGLIDSAQSFYDPSRLIERNLPALLEQQDRATSPTTPIQPAARVTLP